MKQNSTKILVALIAIILVVGAIRVFGASLVVNILSNILNDVGSSI